MILALIWRPSRSIWMRKTTFQRRTWDVEKDSPKVQRWREGCFQTVWGPGPVWGVSTGQSKTPRKNDHSKLLMCPWQWKWGVSLPKSELGDIKPRGLHISRSLGNRYDTEPGHNSENKRSTRNDVVQFPVGMLFQEENEIDLRKQRNVVFLPYQRSWTEAPTHCLCICLA